MDVYSRDVYFWLHPIIMYCSHRMDMTFMRAHLPGRSRQLTYLFRRYCSMTSLAVPPSHDDRSPAVRHSDAWAVSRSRTNRNIYRNEITECISREFTVFSRRIMSSQYDLIYELQKCRFFLIRGVQHVKFEINYPLVWWVNFTAVQCSN